MNLHIAGSNKQNVSGLNDVLSKPEFTQNEEVLMVRLTYLICCRLLIVVKVAFYWRSVCNRKHTLITSLTVNIRLLYSLIYGPILPLKCGG